MNLIKYFLSTLMISQLLPGCEEDVYTPLAKSSFPVVYFILDRDDTARYVRLTKTFSGPVSAYVMAQNPDSLYYNNARVFFEMSGKTIELKPTEEIVKDTGVFFSEYSRLYKTTYPLCGYVRLHIILPDDGIEIFGGTSVMGAPVFTAPDPQRDKVFSFYEDEFVTIQWNGFKGVCQTTLRFNYLEITESGMDTCYVDWIRKSADFAILPQDLLDFLNHWIHDRPEVRYRKILGFDILVTTGNQALASYMSFKDWSIDYIDTPYSNLINAYGLVAARVSGALTGYLPNQRFMDSLVESKTTEHLNFVRW